LVCTGNSSVTTVSKVTLAFWDACGCLFGLLLLSNSRQLDDTGNVRMGINVFLKLWALLWAAYGMLRLLRCYRGPRDRLIAQRRRLKIPVDRRHSSCTRSRTVDMTPLELLCPSVSCFESRISFGGLLLESHEKISLIRRHPKINYTARGVSSLAGKKYFSCLARGRLFQVGEAP